MTADGRPEVFISYSYDSQDHENWVKSFVDRLISDGVQVIFDKYDLHLGDKSPHFMETSINKCDFILVIVTEQYINKADTRSGGVGYETDMVAGDLLLQEKKGKVIPVWVKTDYNKVPEYLKGTMGISIKNLYSYDSEYEKLYRTITSQELKKPELGSIKIFDSTEQEKIFDIKELGKKKQLDYWCYFDCIMKINGLDNFSTAQLYREIQQNRISLAENSNYFKNVPFVLDDYAKKMHNNPIVFELGDLSPYSNRGMYEKVILKNMIMRYSYIELADNRDDFILLHLMNILRDLLHIIFILQKIEKKYNANISIETSFLFESNKKTEYAVNLRQFIEGDTLTAYELQNNTKQSYIIKSLSNQNIINFLNRILEWFCDKNQKSAKPFLCIKENHFDQECFELKKGKLYIEL